MKRIVSLLLVLCFCVGLAACGKSASPSTATPAPAAAPAAAASAEAPAATPAPTPVPTPEVIDLLPLVEELNYQEASQRTDDDPSIGAFEVGKGKNTINYKFAMQFFDFVIVSAQQGDSESRSAYNRVVESLPGLESSLENALRVSEPDLNIVVYLMESETSDKVAAVCENGEIFYDLVNGVGTEPPSVTPIFG